MPRKANKQSKLHLKKGDQVRVIAGNSKNKEGKILRVFRKKERVIIEGVNMRIHHTKPNQLYPEGARVEKEMPVHISNVMPLDSNGDPTRVGRKLIEDADSGTNRWVRYAKTTGEELDH